MELYTNREQQLAELCAAPDKVSAQDIGLLNELLVQYPYYQPLHLLLAKAGQPTGDHSSLAKASLYTNGPLLHQFLFDEARPAVNFRLAEGTAPVAVPDEQETFEEITEQLLIVDDSPVHSDPEEEVYEEISELPPFSAADAAPFNAGEAPAETDDAAEEIYEEIAEVDLNNYRPFRNSAQPAEQEEQKTEDPVRKNSLEDNFVFESIASSDFFAFEQNFSPEVTEPEEAKPQQEAPYIEEHDEAAAAEAENSQVSNYHDEKLPYTFLWWLDKTRKEHQSIFQPYASPKKGASQELHQQYVEHIFHMQSPLADTEVLLDTPEQHKPATRDAELIESFIKNDPQISPPKAEQIDNENKAKKSAEDQNDLVSETLANIYIEQMLYDKAIDTYEKLSLKFPEKSRYFADLIQSIEKKI